MKTILLVDDDISLRSVLAEVLRAKGYEVVEAADGREALNCFDRKPTDLVVTDLIMPE